MLVIRSDTTMIRVIVNGTHALLVLNAIIPAAINAAIYSKHNTRTWVLNVLINE